MFKPWHLLLIFSIAASAINTTACIGSCCYHYAIDQKTLQPAQKTMTWQQECLPNSTEFIVSWDAKRPLTGSLLFSVQVQYTDLAWSDWIPIAAWGHNFQTSFPSLNTELINRDGSILMTRQPAKIFAVRVDALDGASLSNLHRLTMNTAPIRAQTDTSKNSLLLPSVLIKGVPQRSQLLVKHPDAYFICAPTSASNTLNYLLAQKNLPTIITETLITQVQDRCYVDYEKLSAFGNWTLNTSAIYACSHGAIQCHVERLKNFAHLHDRLQAGYPVVVSICCKVPGGAFEYEYGHLITVIGWDQETQSVICIDPAFPTDEQTMVSYALADFLIAWEKNRHGLAFIFEYAT